MKKLIAFLTLAILLSSAMPMTAIAHGHSTTKKTTKTCSVKKCNKTSMHKHGKMSYKGHSIGDGHSYHKLCTKKNCKKTGSHSHSGKTYMPHHKSDGHSYHNSGKHH